MKEHVLQAKKDVVAEILGKINQAQAMVLVEYRGLNVQEVTELRKRYREAGVEYKVYKNTMMDLAFKEAGIEDFCEHLAGPNGIAFGMQDAVAVAKVTQEFMKTHEKLIVKAGVVDGKTIDPAGVKALASLPSREVLIAQVLGGFNAPIQGFASVLNGTLSKLVYALDAVREKKEEEAA
ncbi:MAG: 50S ribosomal protein L10 [Tissierellia bacterium]|nr:50S ribosomal protein L10 [Tissierellia bacterium]